MKKIIEAIEIRILLKIHKDGLCKVFHQTKVSWKGLCPLLDKVCFILYPLRVFKEGKQ
ncbi:MAG: hypothetical protein AABY22_17230 [Nanoarchaeota archaeon]